MDCLWIIMMFFISGLNSHFVTTHSLQRIHSFFCETYKIFLADCLSLSFLYNECEWWLFQSNIVKNDLNFCLFLTQSFYALLKDLEYSAQDIWTAIMVAHTSLNVFLMALFVFFLWFSSTFIAWRTAELPKEKGTKSKMT